MWDQCTTQIKQTQHTKQTSILTSLPKKIENSETTYFWSIGKQEVQKWASKKMEISRKFE